MAVSVSALTERDRQVLAELEALARETYQLWDEIWVGFSWRNYTYDHVMRVRNLARTIATRENGDVRALEFGATLHDITKSFDGEILVRDGKRVLDEEGFWLNEKLPPARRNRVTDLYDELGLAGTVHHVSGGHIATALLADYGYDADTIDANIGLPAFYRNIQITMHRLDQDYSRRDESLDDYLNASLESYLQGYLSDRIPTWVNGKRDDFIAKLNTEAGRQVARERIEYLAMEVAAMADELADYAHGANRGRLAVVNRFILNRRNPSLAAEVEYLSNGWSREAMPTAGATALLERYRQELAGER